MTAAQHTKGPWVAIQGKHGCWIEAPNKTLTFGNNVLDMPEYQHAADTVNALVEAVETWLEFFNTMPKGQFAKISCDIGLMSDGFIQSAAAIRRARGEV